jgi:peptide/nickel transport system substrate-binding protein
VRRASGWSGGRILGGGLGRAGALGSSRRRRFATSAAAAAVVTLSIVVNIVLDISSRQHGATPPGSPGGQAGGRLVYGYSTAFPGNLFPLISAGNSAAVAYLEVRVLPAPTKYTPDFKIVPDLELLTAAPTTELRNGKQVVTYRLNPKAVWSDGVPIDAKDFKFSWQLQRNGSPVSGCPDLISTLGYDQIESVTGSNRDKTVTVTFAKPYADWQSLYNSQLFPAHLMDKHNAVANCAEVKAGWPTAGGLPVSGGPWNLDKANVDAGKQTITLVRNERYWGAKPKLDQLIYQRIGTDPSTMVKALKAGEIQLAYPQPQTQLVADIKALEPDVTSKVSFGLSFEHLDFNTRNPALADVRVRKAIATAIDRPSLVAATVGQFDNRAQVDNNRMFVNNQPQYRDNSDGLYYKGDVPKARQLLESAGYRLGSDGIYAKGSTKLAFDTVTTVQNPLREHTVDVLASQLKPAGVLIRKDLDLDIFDDRTKPKSLEAGGFDIALYAWVSSPFVSGNNAIYQSVVGDAQGQNYVHGNDPKVDDLLTRMVAEIDPTKQANLANQVDTQLWTDMFTLPLYQKPTLLAWDTKYIGIDENATNSGPLWNSEAFARKA